MWLGHHQKRQKRGQFQVPDYSLDKPMGWRIWEGACGKSLKMRSGSQSVLLSLTSSMLHPSLIPWICYHRSSILFPTQRPLHNNRWLQGHLPSLREHSLHWKTAVPTYPACWVPERETQDTILNSDSQCKLSQFRLVLHRKCPGGKSSSGSPCGVACQQSQADMAPEGENSTSNRTAGELTRMCWGCSTSEAGVKMLPGYGSQRHERDICTSCADRVKACKPQHSGSTAGEEAERLGRVRGWGSDAVRPHLLSSIKSHTHNVSSTWLPNQTWTGTTDRLEWMGRDQETSTHPAQRWTDS